MVSNVDPTVPADLDAEGNAKHASKQEFRDNFQTIKDELEALQAISGALPTDDTTSLVQDPVDNTRQMRIDVGAVSTATVRTLTMPDNDVDLGDLGGLVIGTTVQAQSARLDEIAALTPSDSTFIVGDGAAWVAETGVTVRTSLDVDQAGTDNSTDVSLLGEDFITIAGQVITANPIDLDNLSATGVPSAATFLRGDNTWATPAGSGDVTKVGTPVNNQIGVWTGDGTIEGAADFTWNGFDFNIKVASNDANPEIRLGASASEEAHWQVIYESGTQTLERVEFRTESGSATADFGLYRFDVDGTDILDIDDGGINFTANTGISIAGTDIITDAAGVATLLNIDAIDATTEATLEAAIDSLVNLTVVGTIATGVWNGTDIAVADGGTGAGTAADARTNLDVDQAGTDNSTDVTLAGTPDYITISGQIITRGLIDLTADVTGDLPVAEGGTGASTPAAARTNLDVDQAGTDNSTNVTLAGEDFLSLSGQEITANPIDLDNFSATGTPTAANFLRGDNTWATPAGSGDVTKVGTPVDNQVGVWTGDGTIEGDTALTFDTATDTLAIGASGDLAFGAIVVLSDAAGTTTLQNIDAIDATTETTLEAAIDSLTNLTVVGTVVTGNVDAVVSAASATLAGKVELATEAEVFTGTDTTRAVTPAELKPRESIILAVSDETTALTTGTAKLTFRMPYDFELSEVRASVTTAPTGAVLTVDINETASTILSTKLTIDATETTSETAAAAAVISDTTLADDAEITIDIDTVGSTIAGAGLKVALIGNRT